MECMFDDVLLLRRPWSRTSASPRSAVAGAVAEAIPARVSTWNPRRFCTALRTEPDLSSLPPRAMLPLRTFTTGNVKKSFYRPAFEHVKEAEPAARFVVMRVIKTRLTMNDSTTMSTLEFDLGELAGTPLRPLWTYR